jgi:hypothetical protein
LVMAIRRASIHTQVQHMKETAKGWIGMESIREEWHSTSIPNVFYLFYATSSAGPNSPPQLDLFCFCFVFLPTCKKAQLFLNL